MGTLSCPRKQGLGSRVRAASGRRALSLPGCHVSWLPLTSGTVRALLGRAEGRADSAVQAVRDWMGSWVGFSACSAWASCLGSSGHSFFFFVIVSRQFSWASDQLLLTRLCHWPQENCPSQQVDLLSPQLIGLPRGQ